MFNFVLLFFIMFSCLLLLAVGFHAADKYAAWDEADKASRRRKLEIIRRRA